MYTICAEAADCQESGYSGETLCKNCGFITKHGSVIPIKDHSGGTATCIAKAICAVCGESYGELGGHNYKATVTPPTCTSAGFTTYTCTLCTASYKGAYVAAAHSWGAWKTVKPATASEKGIEERACTVCKKTEQRELPKLLKITIKDSANIIALPGGIAAVPTGLTNDQLLSLFNDGVKLPDKAKRPCTGMQVTLYDGKTVIDKITLCVKGDADGDGLVTAADARLALRQAVRLEKFTGAFFEAADVNGDGKVNAGDARLVLRAAVKLETEASLFKVK